MSKGAKREALATSEQTSDVAADVHTPPEPSATLATAASGDGRYPEVGPVYRVRPMGRLKLNGRVYGPGEAVPLSLEEAADLAEVVTARD